MGRTDGPIVLYDGVCNLCAWSVAFVIERDRRQRFRFASLQSEVGRRLLEEHGCPGTGLDSVVLLAEGRCLRKSRAALEIARRLDPPWPALYALIIVPGPLADRVYDFIGARRYRWFGRADRCHVPRGDSRGRFLDAAEIPGKDPVR